MILRRTLIVAAALGLAFVASPPASAHSLDSLQSELQDKEKYFEAKGRPAPDFALQDADGNPHRLSDVRGKVVVLHFIYAGCTDVCPLHAERIAEIQGMVNSTPMKDQVQFITITTDPERDTPDIMRAYGDAHGLKAANWAFLTSGAQMPEDTTRRLAEQFGHKFTKTPDGMQMHGVVTHVIDREARLVANFHGLKFEPTNLVSYINALVNGGDHHGQGSGGSLWKRLRSLF